MIQYIYRDKKISKRKTIKRKERGRYDEMLDRI